jgi:hypothetical protein
MEQSALSVDEFLAVVPNATRRADAEVLARLMADVTGQPPAMWGTSIIGFGRYHYRYATGREGDSPVVGFSPRKAQLVLYLTDGFEEYGELLGRLGKHSTGKSCLYVKRLADVDLAVLEELVRRSVAEVSGWPRT